MSKKLLVYIILGVLLCLALAAVAFFFAPYIKTAAILATGAFLVIVARFAWLVAQKGWGWGLAMLHAWANRGKADIAEFQTGLTTLEDRIAGLEPRIKAIEDKLGGFVPLPSVKGPPVVVLQGGAPVVDASGVQQSPGSNG